MKIKFAKMHGAGNDFVLIDDRDGKVPWEDHFLMAALASRRVGTAVSASSQLTCMSPFSTRFKKPLLTRATVRASTKISAAVSKPGTAAAMAEANCPNSASNHAVDRSPHGRVYANW